MSSLASKMLSLGLAVITLMWTQVFTVSCGYIAFDQQGGVTLMIANHDVQDGRVVVAKYTTGLPPCEGGRPLESNSSCPEGNEDHFPLVNEPELISSHAPLTAPLAILSSPPNFFDASVGCVLFQNPLMGLPPYAEFTFSPPSSLLVAEYVVLRV